MTILMPLALVIAIALIYLLLPDDVDPDEPGDTDEQRRAW